MKKITSLRDIDNSTMEGRLLIAALAKISTESQTDKEPDEILKQVVKLDREMQEEVQKSL